MKIISPKVQNMIQETVLNELAMFLENEYDHAENCSMSVVRSQNCNCPIGEAIDLVKNRVVELLAAIQQELTS